MTGYIELPDYRTALADGVRLPAPEFYNFGFDLIDRRAAERDKTAFVYVDANTGEQATWRFSDLSAASNRFANVLRGIGAAKGDFAFMMIPRIPAWYDAMIGCIKLGVVAMPGTNLLQPKDIEYRINKARARLAIITADHIAKIEAVRDKCPTLEQVIAIGAPHGDWVHCEAACALASDRLDRSEVEATRSDETMLAYFTSGTTAFPKLVPRDHSYAIAHTLTARYWHDLREDDLHWTMSDTGWAKAAWGKLFGQWQLGTAVMLYNPGPGFDADAHLRLIGEHGITTFCAPPTAFRAFMQMDLSAYDLSSIRHSISAGEPLNPEAVRAWKDATGHDPSRRLRPDRDRQPGRQRARASRCGPAPWASRCRAWRSISSTTTATAGRTMRSAISRCGPTATPGRPAFSTVITRTTRPTPNASATAGTTPAIRRPGTPTAISGSSAGPTT